MAYRNESNPVTVASGLNLLAGLWLILSPWVSGYADNGGAVTNSIMVGIVIAILAAARQAGAATGWSWVNAILGAWMIAAPFVFDYSLDVAGAWNSIIVGLIIVALGATSGLAGETTDYREEAGASSGYGSSEPPYRDAWGWQRPPSSLMYPTGWTSVPRPGSATYRGRGPRGYARSDEQLRTEVCDRMADHPMLDAGNIDVSVENGDVRLQGTVSDRAARRLAEDIADSVSGVRDVHNELRVPGREEERRRAA
jgi:hypothetical protein